MSGPRVSVGGRAIGPGAPAFVIAEAGVNHNGDVDLAHRLVDAAADAAADAVKFQTFSPGALVTAAAPKAAYQERTTASGGGQQEMLAQLELPRPAWAELRRHAEERGLIFLSTPFDRGSLDLLVGLGVPALKVSSGDLTNTPLLRAMARTGLPVILSTGMATLGDVGRALADLDGADVVLLHCVSAYPASAEDCNLRAMATLAAAFERPVGFSDHTMGTEVTLAAVALGACAIEKHLTLDRALPGPDHSASLEPAAFSDLVAGIRVVESALGSGRKEPVAAEADVMDAGRRSLVAARDLAPGDVLDEGSVAARRPAGGIAPTQVDRLLGRRVRRPVGRDQRLAWDDLDLA